MSGGVFIRVYYGDAPIQYCDSGVDFSVYPFVDANLNTPEQLDMFEVLGWLHSMFDVDPMVMKFVVKAVWPSKSELGWKWKVVDIASTGSWRKYVNTAMSREYGLAILVQKKIVQSEQGEASQMEVEVPKNPIQAREPVEQVVAPALAPDIAGRADDSDDEEPDSPLRADQAEENEAVVEQI